MTCCRKLTTCPPTLAVALALLLVSGHAGANPTGPTVVSGNSTFTSSGTTLTITNSSSAIINWQSFSIPASSITQFIQQSNASAVLNRVVTGNPSSILGTLQSNGAVFIVNPNGVIFGAGAQINTPSLTATTGQISDGSFLSGAPIIATGASSFVSSGPFALGGTLTVYTSAITLNGPINGGGPFSFSTSGNLIIDNGGTPGSITIPGGSTVTTGTGSGSNSGAGVTITGGETVAAAYISSVRNNTVGSGAAATTHTIIDGSAPAPHVAAPVVPAAANRVRIVLEKREPLY